ncbi:hypothetical protein SPRG_08166 [Saprolegnia parasitica CBS 223.65]|uniref:Uncharacterized protein n=1 Tax=Saprolegnia parasitica (strain CBS 223.65) TaxID=695850 RepID=A0A067C784_SAPPC|nr:hypothetical protein SPRG_08166 [Saprolegnia parasitica CBS 223.65]KDO26363.1 hypothetical protein SPRG_08166 [Saprolegnia parasitica CBS 223.65]|eukprot:XP_012202801.1 hypothetical protein SPRG_08166 [Saprolegnia parasitica CBS 223.65]
MRRRIAAGLCLLAAAGLASASPVLEANVTAVRRGVGRLLISRASNLNGSCCHSLPKLDDEVQEEIAGATEVLQRQLFMAAEHAHKVVGVTAFMCASVLFLYLT